MASFDVLVVSCGSPVMSCGVLSCGVVSTLHSPADLEIIMLTCLFYSFLRCCEELLFFVMASREKGLFRPFNLRNSDCQTVTDLPMLTTPGNVIASDTDYMRSKTYLSCGSNVVGGR